MSDPEAARRLYQNARREALIVAGVWAVSFLWTIGYCYLFGYTHDENSLPVVLGIIKATPQPAPLPKLVLGFPDWIFTGIMVPWLLCSAFTIWFGAYGMTDDDLGVEAKEEQSHGH